MSKRILFESNIESYKNELSYTVKISNVKITMGNTIGNMIRRLLITSIPGTSVQGFSLTDLQHNFDYNSYIDKDADQIGDTIREIIFVYNPDLDAPELIETTLEGPKQIYAKDLFPNHAIINENLLIFNILNKKTIKFKAWLINGIGFIPYFKQSVEDGVIPITSIFTHNKNVSFVVANNNIDDQYEDLTITFTTYNIFPNDKNQVIKYALEHIKDNVMAIYNAIDNKNQFIDDEEEKENVLLKEIEECINQVQPELAAYIYEASIDITNISQTIEFLKQIPAQANINNVKIKRKEITALIKLLMKLKKTNKIQ